MRREVIYSADGGSTRVFRGGSWSFDDGYVRASYSYGYVPGDRYGGLGFRIVRKKP